MQDTYTLLKQLSTVRSESGGTSLVSYFLPNVDQASIINAINKLNQELSISSNIKSKIVRKDIIASLKSGIYHLKNYKNYNNKSGIVLFSGRITCNQYYL